LFGILPEKDSGSHGFFSMMDWRGLPLPSNPIKET